MFRLARAFSDPFMNIVDLRQTTVRQLEPLLEEEASHWRDELHWDYRGALDLIKRFLEAHALCGSVAFENGTPAGYSFYVLEEQKGLIGGLYVSNKYAQATIGRRLLEEMLFSMRAVPQLARIEAQLMPFGGPVDTPLLEQGFHLYTRQFMLLDLRKPADPKPAPSSRHAARSLERSIFRTVRKVDLPLLCRSHRRRDQRSIPQPQRRAEISEEHYFAAGLRQFHPERVVCVAAAG